MRTFGVGDITVGDGQLVLIAGPCMAESLDLCTEVAETVSGICKRLGIPYIFKASFDKANRTSAESKRGVGIDEGLGTLAMIKDRLGLPTTTDIHLPEQAATVAQTVDLLQIPAFLCRQSDLLEAAAITGRPVNVKKGQFLAPWDAKNIVEKMDSFGCQGLMLTERGTSFGYNTLVVDMPGLATMRSFGVPVCMDATHSAQRPGGAGTQSGGNREAIPYLAKAAVAVGIDALFMEIHPNPDRALSDAATQWPLHQAEPLLAELKEIHEIQRTKASR